MTRAWPGPAKRCDQDARWCYLDLADGGLALARWLGDAEHVSLMAPVRPDARAQ